MSKTKTPSIKRLHEIMDELYEHIQDQDRDIKELSNELNYLNDFIKWQGLSEEYNHFRANAHEVRLDEDLPFTTYVL
jgi:hypothetical protein